MMKVCEPCHYRAADNDETACPKCGGQLRFSFLSFDASSTPQPPVPIPPRPTAPSESWLPDGWRAVWEHVIESPTVMIVLLILLSGGAWGVGGWVLRASYSDDLPDLSGRIRVGMPIAEVNRLLDPGSLGPAHAPRSRISDDDLVDGTIEYEGNGVKLRIQFANGRVTAVEEAPSASGPGMHSYVLTIH
jgi:hypothetical protein